MIPLKSVRPRMRSAVKWFRTHEAPRVVIDQEPEPELKKEPSLLSIGSWDLPALTADFNRHFADATVCGGRSTPKSAGQGFPEPIHNHSGRESPVPASGRSGFSMRSASPRGRREQQQQQQQLDASADPAADLRKVARWLRSRPPGGDLENTRLQGARWVDRAEVPEEGQNLLVSADPNGPATSRTFVLGCVVRLRGHDDRRHEKLAWRDQLIEGLRNQRSTKQQGLTLQVHQVRIMGCGPYTDVHNRFVGFAGADSSKGKLLQPSRHFSSFCNLARELQSLGSTSALAHEALQSRSDKLQGQVAPRRVPGLSARRSPLQASRRGCR